MATPPIPPSGNGLVADKLLATAFGAGLSPFAPGTMGAVAGVAVWWIAALWLPYTFMPWLTLAATVLFTLISVPSISRLERVWGKDPSRVVIDEVVGVWICLMAVPSRNAWGYVLAAFLLFRFFDIAKPLGVRHMENINGGWGVMLDDILAGVYGLVLLLVYRFIC